MPRGRFHEKYVQCPFYRSDNGKSRINCEGVTDGSRLSQSFREQADYETQMTVFCCEHYRNCELYTLLMAKYEEA